MAVKEKTIETYEQTDGKRPYETWLKDLKDAMSRARIRSRIDKAAMRK